jgi:rod shape-determining protein MreD
MLQNIFIFLAIFITGAFQVSFLPHIFSAEKVPDFLLILILFWATRMDFSRILLRVIWGGIVLDMAYFAPIGLNVSAFVFTAFSINYLAKKFLVEQETWKFFITLGLIVLGALLNDWILAIFSGFFPVGQEIYGRSLFFNCTLGAKLFFDAVLFALLYWPLIKLEKFFTFYGARINMSK